MDEEKSEHDNIRGINIRKPQTLILWIGGVSCGFREGVELNIATYDAFNLDEFHQLEVLETLVKKINKLNINASDYDNNRFFGSKLGLFFKYINQLMELTCVINFQKQIHNAIGWFFTASISNMFPKPQEPETSGYDKYLRKIDQIEGKLRVIQDVMYESRFELQHAAFEALVNSSSCSGDFFDILPKNLYEFEQSIDRTFVCLDEWKVRFVQCEDNPRILSEYASKITIEIRELSVECPFHAKHIIDKIYDFTKMLEVNRVCLGLASIFSEMVYAANSPRRADSTSVEYKLSMKLEPLKREIDVLIRENQLFDERFVRFKQSLSILMSEVRKQARYIILSELKGYIQENATSSKQGKILNYIEQCIHRMKVPLPEKIASDCEKLERGYSLPGATKHQKAKLTFLRLMIDTIHEHPEKSYYECLKMSLKNADPQMVERVLRYKNYKCTLWIYKSQFDNWISNVLMNDPPESRGNILNLGMNLNMDMDLNIKMRA